MLKVACDEVLGSGAVLWFQNQSTNDIHAGIDGSNNQNLVSWFAVREGVIGFPTALSHLDLWLNYSYKREELEGFATLKDSSEDGWDYKEKEVLAKYNAWRKTAILGRIGADVGVLNMVNPTGNIGKTQEILEQLLDKGLIVDDTTLYINNCHLGKISDLFKGEEPVFGRFAKMFVSAQGEGSNFSEFAPDAPAGKPVAPHDAKLKGLRAQYKALQDKGVPKGSPEYGEILKDTIWTLVGNADLKEKDSYYRMMFSKVKPRLPKGPTMLDEAMSLISSEVAPTVAQQFLTRFDESKSSIVTFLHNYIDWAVKNWQSKEKYSSSTLTDQELQQLEVAGIPEDIIKKLSILKNSPVLVNESGKASLLFEIKKLLGKETLNTLIDPVNPEKGTYGSKIGEVLKENLADTPEYTFTSSFSTGYDNDKQVMNPIEQSQVNYDGQVREDAPAQRAISSENMQMLADALPNFSPIEKFVIDSRYFQDLTLDQTAEHLAKRFPNKGVLTRERIRQIEEKVLALLKHRLTKKFPEMSGPQKNLPEEVNLEGTNPEEQGLTAKKKVFLSVAHQKANGG